MARIPEPRIIFITGTDTGVGKTVLTGLLLTHLRQTGRRAFALKPFCSGGRADAEILHALQDGELSLDQINPFYFEEPVAPLAAARLHRRKISLDQTLKHIGQVYDLLLDRPAKISRANNEVIQHSNNPVRLDPILLIEGAGGLLAPLGQWFSAEDLIKTLRCEVIVTAANRLGTLNHTALTGRILQEAGAQRLRVVLMDCDGASPITQASHRSSAKSKLASRMNRLMLCEMLHPTAVFHLPHITKLAKIPGKTERRSLLITCGKKLKKTLAQILQ